MAHTKVYRQAAERLRASCPYSRKYWTDFDYALLDQIRTVKRPSKKGKSKTYNDIIIMLDTESSKDHVPVSRDDIAENHIVIWTISLRAYGSNMVTLWGRRPDECAQCVKQIHEGMSGEVTLFFVHNLGWDWTYLRRFLMAELGTPKGQLNVKPYYPIYIEFKNGIMLRDTLILSQRKLEKWADDLKVEHRKAVGYWDYDKIRHQDPKLTQYTEDELTYAEYDTLAGVECIDATMQALKAKIYTLPYTMTGIVRNETKNRGRKHHAHAEYLKIAPSWEGQMISEMLFHGGYTHGSRYQINWINKAQCRDFASKYPTEMLLEKFPMEKFHKFEGDITKEQILQFSEKYATKFMFSAKNVRLKDKMFPMPMIQRYKCIQCEGDIVDNGRVISCDYMSIFWTEMDLKLWDEIYTADKIWITNLEYSRKDYLPRWFTDFVYELFRDKCQLKNGDPVIYQLKKGMLNSEYGNLVQKPVKVTIKEDYTSADPGAIYKEAEDFNPEEEYEKHVKKFSSILPYDAGCWVTAYAQYDLFQLAKCIASDGLWLYSDTDSIYATKWDEEKLDAYNKGEMQRLKDRGYEPVEHEGRLYYPGVAEFDGDYSEFKFCGAKRYCCRYSDDPRNKEADRGKLKLTVSGVPKKGGAKCLKDDINNFRPGFVFDGEITGKTQHTHFYHDVHVDKYGNLIGDSIDLSPCDYKLDDIFNTAKKLDKYLDPDYEEEVFIQIYEED